MAEMPVATEAKAERIQRYRKAAELLRKWLDAEDGYDERAWPVIEKELADSRMECRSSDDPSA